MRRILTIIIALGLLLAACGHRPPATRQAAPLKDAPARLLIKHGWDMPSVAFAADHRTAIEAAPFHGVILTSDIMDRVFTARTLSLPEARKALAAYAHAPWSEPRYDFLLLFASHPRSADRPPDWLDNWDQVYENLTVFAKAARMAGFYGIAFDSEPYGDNWFSWNISDGPPPAEIVAAVSEHGERCIGAIESVWPEAHVLTLLGPWVGIDAKGRLTGRWPMIAPFVGSFLGGAQHATTIEGGQFYSARTTAEFASYRHKLIHDYPALYPFLPKAFREAISTRVSIAFGVYDRDFDPASGGGDALRDGEIVGRLTRALAASDGLVWFYSEAYHWWESLGGHFPAVPAAQRRSMEILFESLPSSE